MGIMVYSLLWVMQDFVHQPYLNTHFESWNPTTERSWHPQGPTWGTDVLSDTRESSSEQSAFHSFLGSGRTLIFDIRAGMKAYDKKVHRFQ